MESDTEPKIALVTGAGARVGRRIALRLAESGMTIAAHYHTSLTGVTAMVRQVQGGGGAAEAFQADLSTLDGAATLAQAVLRRFGRIDLLVNSASLWERTPITDITEEQFDRLMAVNLRSPFFLCMTVGRAMKDQGGGLIVNLLDWSVERPYPDYVPYGMTKAALAAATRGLARALAPDVRVNAVAPGAVLLPEGTDPTEAEKIRAAIPLGRIGSPDDVAEAVLYLQRAPYVTGTILTVDGGRSLR